MVQLCVIMQHGYLPLYEKYQGDLRVRGQQPHPDRPQLRPRTGNHCRRQGLRQAVLKPLRKYSRNTHNKNNIFLSLKSMRLTIYLIDSRIKVEMLDF